MIFNLAKIRFPKSRARVEKRRKSTRANFGFESLENRRMLAVYTVNSPLDFADLDPTTLTLREAIELANADHHRDTIVFDFNGPTTIELKQAINSGNGDYGKPLDITSDIDILGPGIGQLTIASGDGLERRAFVVHDHGAPEVTIRDLSISGFHTAENYVNPDKPNTEHGPAITNWSILNLINVQLRNNSTIFGGGAIYNAGTLNIDSGEFINNRADESGGAIYTHDTRQISGDSILTIKNSIFEHNIATRGGAIYNHNQVGNGLQEYMATAVLLIRKSLFVDNQAVNGHGGAVYSSRAGLEIHQSEFVQNSAILVNHDTGRGGAIYTYQANSNHNNFKPETIIMDSTFDRNFAERGGAINFTGDQAIKVVNSTFSANHASFQGGAIYFYSIFGVATLINNTITENSVGSTNSGIGGGIYSQDVENNSLPRMFNNIVSNNRKITGNPSNYWGFFHPSSDYNLVGAADATQTTPGLHINNFIDDFDEDPGLGPLADNGGPTRTHAIVGKEGDARNSGDPFAQLRNGTPFFDQRGSARIVDGRIDIGSFEATDSVGSGAGFATRRPAIIGPDASLMGADEARDQMVASWFGPIVAIRGQMESDSADSSITIGDSKKAGERDLEMTWNSLNDKWIHYGLDDEFQFWTLASAPS